jgi:hypothetical protein
MEHSSEIVVGNVSRRSISEAPVRPFLQENKNGLLASSLESGVAKNLQDVDRKTHTRVKAVVHVIPAVVYDVHIVVIAPAHWPRRAESEVVTAVCEAMSVIVAAVHLESMPAAEAGIVVRFRNSAVRAIVTAAVLRRCVCLRRMSLIRSIVGLRRAHGRLRVLLRCGLGGLRVRRRLVLCRRLGFLRVRWLRMFLRGFGLLRVTSLGMSFLRFFLPAVNGSGRAQKENQCGQGDRVFHKFHLEWRHRPVDRLKTSESVPNSTRSCCV